MYGVLLQIHLGVVYLEKQKMVVVGIHMMVLNIVVKISKLRLRTISQSNLKVSHKAVKLMGMVICGVQ